MNRLILSVLIISGLQFVSADEVGVKVDTNQDTTISVKKGSTSSGQKKYSIVEGGHELIGDIDVVAKSAQNNWKSACSDWKKEFRQDNKDNKIISVVCGRMACEKVGVETTCRSEAKYKIKTLSEE
jgi:hypothetical protein